MISADFTLLPPVTGKVFLGSDFPPVDFLSSDTEGRDFFLGDSWFGAFRFDAEEAGAGG